MEIYIWMVVYLVVGITIGSIVLVKRDYTKEELERSAPQEEFMCCASCWLLLPLVWLIAYSIELYCSFLTRNNKNRI